MNAPLTAKRRADSVACASLVIFDKVSKSYDGRSNAVADLDFVIAQGEFLTLLGPSGSGKTTTLMMLAGFEDPTTGDIRLDGRSLAHKPPHRRNMGVVFQNYALFPHMTVAQNLAFPLGVRGIRGSEAQARMTEMLDLVQLTPFANRKPIELSGGQQQRVALARALIFEPDIVLMDEPLGALDRQLRERMQEEIKRLHRRLGVTIVYVTHDQAEALALSDRIAVFAHGTIQQMGRPEEIYARPANAFVAGFVGENNAIPGVVVDRDAARCRIRLDGGACIEAVPADTLEIGDAVVATVRPECIDPRANAGGKTNRLPVRIVDSLFQGDHTRVRARLEDGTEIAFRSDEILAPATTISIGWAADSCYAFAATLEGQ